MTPIRKSKARGDPHNHDTVMVEFFGLVAKAHTAMCEALLYLRKHNHEIWTHTVDPVYFHYLNAFSINSNFFIENNSPLIKYMSLETELMKAIGEEESK